MLVILFLLPHPLQNTQVDKLVACQHKKEGSKFYHLTGYRNGFRRKFKRASVNVSFSNLQLLPAFPHVEIHLESSRDVIFTLLHITSDTAHSLQECKGLSPYLTWVIADSPKQSISTDLWDCRNVYPPTLPHEKQVRTLSWAGHLQQWKSTRVELWHYGFPTTALQTVKAAQGGEKGRGSLLSLPRTVIP